MKKLFGYDVIIIAVLGVIFGHECHGTGDLSFSAGIAGIGLFVYLVKAICIFVGNNEELFE